MEFDNIIKHCQSPEVDVFVTKYKDCIHNLSIKYNVDKFEVEKRIRLIIPYYIRDDADISVELLFSRMDINLCEYSEYMKAYKKKCGFIEQNIGYGSENMIRRQGSKIIYNGKELVIKEIDLPVAKHIENNVHYAGCFRNESVLRLGLFVENYIYPICYSAYSAIDRENKILPLLNSKIDKSEIVELTRIYSIDYAPKNIISLIISCGAALLKNEGYKLMITALNPYLGFNGKSLLASGFCPYTYREIEYSYSSNGEYIARRHKSLEIEFTNKNMPPNLLLVKTLINEKPPQYRSIGYVELDNITNGNMG